MRLRGNVLTPQGWLDGWLEIDGRRIADLGGRQIAAPDMAAPCLVPGFIDLHVHGGGGADCMEGGAALETMARLHARHGTTSLLATTMTAPREQIESVLGAIACQSRARPPGAARILGAHLEGPYLNRARLGAQPDLTRVAARDEVLHLLTLAPVRVITLAPEAQHDLALIGELAGRGVRVQLGHTDASYEQACAALTAGASGFTHLYNAMSPLAHRAPGAVGAALAHAQFAEMIPDLLHVHPGAIRVALRAIPGLYGVTDATAAAGMPDGQYRLGAQSVHHCLGAVRLADGTLAGSALTMARALCNLVQIGLDLSEAVARLSRLPADYLGLADRGRLACGAFADINVLAPDLGLQETFIEGERVTPAASPA